MNKLSLFNKILNRIHVRIRTTSRQKLNEQFCWFVVPEIIIGVPKYDQGACIAYLLDRLKTNGFNVKYIHPNTLFISWLHWVPSYVRTELKKKTGITLNEYGEKIDDKNNLTDQNEINPNFHTNTSDPNNLMLKIKDPTQIKQNKKDFTPITSYKPSGNLVYDDDLLLKIEGKFS